MNVHIEKREGRSILVYTHKAHATLQWRVYTLLDVPEERREQAKAKQERIALTRNCTVKTVKLSCSPWVVDVLVVNRLRGENV
jgi:hypothetical protein